MLPQSQNASTMVRLYRCMFRFWSSINKYLFWRKLTALLDEQSDGQGVPRSVHTNLETTMKLRRLWVKGPAPSFSKKTFSRHVPPHSLQASFFVQVFLESDFFGYARAIPRANLFRLFSGHRLSPIILRVMRGGGCSNFIHRRGRKAIDLRIYTMTRR